MLRLTAVSAALLALGAMAPASQAAPSDWIGVAAPRSARTGKPFALKASASFDYRRYAPPRRYLAAGVWRHRGEDACPRSVPIERKGWTRAGTLDFYPRGGLADELSTEFVNTKVTLRTPGIYRHCGYVYEIRYSGTSSRPSYAVQAKDSAVTAVRRG